MYCYGCISEVLIKKHKTDLEVLMHMNKIEKVQSVFFFLSFLFSTLRKVDIINKMTELVLLS